MTQTIHCTCWQHMPHAHECGRALVVERQDNGDVTLRIVIDDEDELDGGRYVVLDARAMDRLKDLLLDMRGEL